MLSQEIKSSLRDKESSYNYMAIALLEAMGNFCPSQAEIDCAELIIKKAYHKLFLKKKGEQNQAA